MKLLVKFPTRGRNFKFFDTLDKYYNKLSGKRDVTFLITLDSDDTTMNNKETIGLLSNYHNLHYYFGESKTKIEAVNADIEKISEWDVILIASDDMIPVTNSYDDIILTEMENNFPDTDGVLFFNDGYMRNKLNTLSILGKKYYDRFGYVYHPSYRSVWCDNEFTEVSRILNKEKYVDTVVIRHEHPDWGFGHRDNVHMTNQLNESHDRKNFNLRKNKNFDLS